MTLEEYRSAWQQHEEREVSDADEEELVERVAERAGEFEAKIRRRDLLETLAAVAVVAFFLWEAVTVRSAVARVGATVVVLGAGFVVWNLRRARRDFGTDGAGRPVAERLRLHRRKVQAQIELLESVLWWYLAPLAVGAGLFTVGVADGPREAIVALAVEAGICGVLWWLNRRVVERDLRPRRDELDRLVEDLEDG